MQAIDKLRIMQSWFDYQSEAFNMLFTSLKQLEQVFDYAQKNSLEFMDSDYLNSDNVTEEERKQANKFLKQILKSN